METYHGQVRTPRDAIILFEACRMGMLPRVQRRLSEKERQSIRSGSVFVWDEKEAGMRRWTDGKSWSASRVSGSFLTYREMEGKRGASGIPPPAPPSTSRNLENSRNGGHEMADGEEGPDEYRYKADGLMKQSFSITTSTNQHLHLISYFSRVHCNAATLPQPSADPNFRTVQPAKGLYPESAVHDQGNAALNAKSPIDRPVVYSVDATSPTGYNTPATTVSRPNYAISPQANPVPIQAMPTSQDGSPVGHPVRNDDMSLPALQPAISASVACCTIAAQCGASPSNSNIAQTSSFPSLQNSDTPPNLLPLPSPPQFQGQQHNSPGRMSSSLSQRPQLPSPPESRSRPIVSPLDRSLTKTSTPSTTSHPTTNGGRASGSESAAPHATRDSRSISNGFRNGDHPEANGALRPISSEQFYQKQDTAIAAKSAFDSATNTTTTVDPKHPIQRTQLPFDQSPANDEHQTVRHVQGFGLPDIPARKPTFHEDQRALQALDRVFL